ncbi:cytochrome P450 [Chaetomium strumarium]|uniref:Cytochrome P450 n=1 Tax=Chaetomium strumarium TaxID=1170767 RepID=A0AAJ0GTG7_9PEZI|nr:cytochrome P450 [Chaetomium strumarium]
MTETNPAWHAAATSKLTGNPGLAAIFLLATPFLLTYLITLVSSFLFRVTGKGLHEPTPVPYWLPWLGSYPSFVLDSGRYQRYLQKAFGGNPLRLFMMDRILYFVPHGEAMQSLFRDSRHAVPAPALLTALTIFFGLPKEDVRRFKQHDTTKPIAGPGQRSTTPPTGFAAVDVSRHAMEQHRLDFRVYLQGQSLQRIMARVLDEFAGSISSSFVDGDGVRIGDGWTEFPDLHAFVATRMFEAVARVVFGDGLLRVCPDLYRDFWAFYEALPMLLLKVPRWLNPGIWAARDKMHRNFIDWKRWCAAQSELERGDGDVGREDDEVFDPVWGTHMTKRLVRVYADIGLSEKGIAAGLLSYLSVIFANATPSTLWTTLHILQSDNLKHRIITEMDSAFEPGSTALQPHSLSDLCAGPLLNSVFRETLRLRQLGPVARVPKTPGYLLAGKWKTEPRTPILSVSWLAGRDETFWNTGATLPDGRQEHPLEAFWAERFLSYPDDPLSGPMRPPNKNNPNRADKGAAAGGPPNKERTPEDDKRATLVSSGLEGHFYPFGGGSYRCPGEMFARRLNMGTNALLLRMLDIELVDPLGAREVSSLYDRYPLGDHRFDRPVPIRVRRKAML